MEPNQPVLMSPVAPQPVDQSTERVAQPTRLQALFEGAALGAPQLGREGPIAAQPASAGSQDEHAWARDFDIFGPGPATLGCTRIRDLLLMLEARVTQLTNIVRSLRS